MDLLRRTIQWADTDNTERTVFLNWYFGQDTIVSPETCGFVVQQPQSEVQIGAVVSVLVTNIGVSALDPTVSAGQGVTVLPSVCRFAVRQQQLEIQISTTVSALVTSFRISELSPGIIAGQGITVSPETCTFNLQLPQSEIQISTVVSVLVTNVGISALNASVTLDKSVAISASPVTLRVVVLQPIIQTSQPTIGTGRYGPLSDHTIKSSTDTTKVSITNISKDIGLNPTQKLDTLSTIDIRKEIQSLIEADRLLGAGDLSLRKIVPTNLGSDLERGILEKLNFNTNLDLRDTLNYFINSPGATIVDPNIRKEVNNMTSIGFQWVGLRQADYTKSCSCVKNNADGLRAPLKSCKRCLSTGYVFTDYLVKGFMWKQTLGTDFNSGVGLISTQNRNLVVEHNRPVNKFDYVLELDQDPDTGQIRQPFRIIRTFLVQDVFPMKGDNGRIEFWRCVVEEKTIDSGRPGEQGTNYKYVGNNNNAQPS